MRVDFTEEMRGFYAPGAPGYDTGEILGRAEGIRLGFRLTIGTDDVAAMIADHNHRMRAVGTITCKEFGPAALSTDGEFELFAPAQRGRYSMRYRLPFRAWDGQPMTLLGYKDVGDDHGPDMWPDTTTCYTRLCHGSADWPADPGEPDGSDVAGPLPLGITPLVEPDEPDEHARGILRLTAPMFARQLATFRGTPEGLARFGVFFGQGLLRAYRGPFRRYSV
ncbi:MAG: hypothetical protein KDB70_10335 [Mycobacterium sp.]|nr:hypothetical protein [Mycobacterium sp.]